MTYPTARTLLAVLWLMGCADQGPIAQGRLASPPIVAVNVWGGSSTTSSQTPQVIRQITLHHQGETWPPGTDVARYLQRLQQWSRLTKRWADIPYHYVIASDGIIYAARDMALPGDTNTEYEPTGHALVMLLGNFEDVQPSSAQLRATVELMAWLVQQHRLDVSAIGTHRDFSAQTVCPGKNLYVLLESGWLRHAVASTIAGLPYAVPLSVTGAVDAQKSHQK